jgi:hypothetical protein
MKSKEEVIYSMCLTYRPDYEIRKNIDDPPWILGMTETEAKMLYKVMEALYNDDIEPLLKRKLNRKNLFGEDNAPRRRKRKTKS